MPFPAGCYVTITSPGSLLEYSFNEQGNYDFQLVATNWKGLKSYQPGSRPKKADQKHAEFLRKDSISKLHILPRRTVNKTCAFFNKMLLNMMVAKCASLLNQAYSACGPLLVAVICQYCSNVSFFSMY